MGTGKKSRVHGELRQRDGDRCHLCHLPVWFDAPLRTRRHGDGKIHTHQLHPAAPSVDHVIPKSVAKVHRFKAYDSLDNLKLAHRFCNSVRGNDGYKDGRRRVLNDPRFILWVKWPLVGMGLCGDWEG